MQTIKKYKWYIAAIFSTCIIASILYLSHQQKQIIDLLTAIDAHSKAATITEEKEEQNSEEHYPEGNYSSGNNHYLPASEVEVVITKTEPDKDSKELKGIWRELKRISQTSKNTNVMIQEMQNTLNTTAREIEYHSFDN